MENRLKEFRKSKGMTMSGFAVSLNMSPSFYYKIEEGQRQPSFAFLAKLKSRYPEVNIDQMFFAK